MNSKRPELIRTPMVGGGIFYSYPPEHMAKLKRKYDAHKARLAAGMSSEESWRINNSTDIDGISKELAPRYPTFVQVCFISYCQR